MTNKKKRQKPLGSGRKPLGKEEFVRRASLIHDNKYDYSKVDYKNNSTKVEIICPIHGSFWQTPQKHLMGRGCPHRDCVNAKRVETSMERFGVGNAMQSKEVQAVLKQTNRERYGVENPMQCAEIQNRLVTSNQKKYGVNSTLELSDVQEKGRQTCQIRYGGNRPLCDADVRKKQQQTMKDRYGYSYPLMSPDLLHKFRQTMQEQYGVDNPAKLVDVQQKILDTKREHQTFHTSKPEELLYEILCDVFGVDDVKRQYSSEDYPFACDFYVVSRQMYIELNASWTHGSHWFDVYSDKDNQILDVWREKARQSDFYANACYVWAIHDVEKKIAAEVSQLNYVVFWDTQLRDAELWFACGCPDANDWKRLYSWIPERNSFVLDWRDYSLGQFQMYSMIAKSYQFSVFYENEMKLWMENPDYKGLSLQMFLYYNRYVYDNKLPDQLTDLGLMRSFTITGIHKGYTVFDASLMEQVIQNYGIQSVYDPCAGWGERMLCCHFHDVMYFGVDINSELKPGYLQMMDDFHMTKQTIQFADARNFHSILSVDAVITCPPYGNIEKYSQQGAENLSETEFLDWWNDVVIASLCSNPKYFCFQINQKWRDKMLLIVEKAGFELVEEFRYRNPRSSHFTRKKDGINQKREYESMLVCKKKIQL